MKILCMNYEYPPIGGGGATVAQSLAEAMVHNGHEVDVVTSGMKDLSDHEIINGVHIHRVRCIRHKRHYSTTPELLTQVIPAYRKALELFEKKKYDINHTHFIVPSGISSYLLKKKTGLPYIITAHGSDVPGYNPDRFDLAHKLIRPVWQRLLANCNGVTSPSHFLKGLIQTNIDIPVDVIPNNYDLSEDTGLERKNRILVASRLVERKGVQFLIEALDVLDEDWEVYIAGDGPYLPTLKKLAAQINTPIHFLGFTPREKLQELYYSSKIFVFPSIQENFPMVLLEAMAAGCAIVTTSVEGNSEVVGDSAIKVEPGNTEQIRNALKKLTSNPEQIQHYSQLARDRVKQFSTSRIATMYQALFDRVIAENNNK